MQAVFTPDDAAEQLRAIAVVISRYRDVVTPPLVERMAADLRAIATSLTDRADASNQTSQAPSS